MLRNLACAAGLIVALIVPVSAGAAEPLTIGVGHKPGVHVAGTNGTAYIAWNGTETPASLHFCRLPRGAAACDISTTIPAPGDSLSRPFVGFYSTGPANGPVDHHLAVVSARHGLAAPDPNQVWEFVSDDPFGSSGPTFDAGHPIGYPAFDESFQLGTNDLLVATNAFGVEGMVVQAMPLDGGSAGAAHAVLSSDHPYHGAVGVAQDGPPDYARDPVAVFANGAGLAQFRRHSGSGDLNDEASWLPPVDIGYAHYPRLASSRTWTFFGLFLMAGTESGGLEVRKWNGTTFGPGVTISDSADDAQAHLLEDSTEYPGSLAAVFPKGTADGLQLFHATSPDGVNWQSRSVFTAPVGAGIFQLRADIGRDHTGVAVWEEGGHPDGNRIRVLEIGPAAQTPATPAKGAPALPSKSKPPAKARRLRNGKVRVVVKGRIGLPAGYAPALACTGQVRVTIKRGKRRIARRTLKLTKDCRFRAVIVLGRSKARKARRLGMTLSFKGNAYLAPASRSYKLKVKGKR